MQNKKVTLLRKNNYWGKYVESKMKSKCPVELFIEVMGSKWKILIIWNLKKRHFPVIRFPEKNAQCEFENHHNSSPGT